jgi:hypothetical protein
MRFQINFARTIKMYCVIDLNDHCRCVAAFDTEGEAQRWVAGQG